MIVINNHGSGGFPKPAGLEVNLIGRLAAKRLVRPNAVVEADVSFQPESRISHGVVGPQADLLVFHAAPQPFDEHVAEPATLSIHADADTGMKDHDNFVEVARRVGATRTDVAFVAVGDGPKRAKLMAEGAERGPGNGFFTAQIKLVEALVAASDIGILCTYGEGVPNSVMEYMAKKNPSSRRTRAARTSW